MVFKQFYEETKHGFFKYVLRLSGDYDSASDLMQEAYLRYYDRYDPPYKKQLLYKIAYHIFVDQYRKSKKNVSIDESEIDIPSRKFSPEVQIEQKRLLGLLQQLPDEDRHLLSMVISDNLSYKDVSEMTGISVANIKVKIHRARKKLKSMVGD